MDTIDRSAGCDTGDVSALTSVSVGFVVVVVAAVAVAVAVVTAVSNCDGKEGAYCSILVFSFSFSFPLVEDPVCFGASSVGDLLFAAFSANTLSTLSSSSLILFMCSFFTVSRLILLEGVSIEFSTVHSASSEIATPQMCSNIFRDEDDGDENGWLRWSRIKRRS